MGCMHAGVRGHGVLPVVHGARRQHADDQHGHGAVRPPPWGHQLPGRWGGGDLAAARAGPRGALPVSFWKKNIF